MRCRVLGLRCLALVPALLMVTGCPSLDDLVGSKRHADDGGEYGYTCDNGRHGNRKGTWAEYFQNQQDRDDAQAQHKQDYPGHNTQQIN